MSIFTWMKDLFKPPQIDRNFWFYVKCDLCGEVLKGRVDLDSHLSVVYGESGDDFSYFCRKVVIGSKRCYRPIEVEFTFNSNRKLLDKTIKGGKFVTEEEFDQDTKS